MAKGTGNLINLAKHFSDEGAAIELLARLRWPNGVACPRCGGCDPYALRPKASGKNPARKGLYKCRACRKQFSVTTGTVFEASHVPVSKWLMALHLICASKKGMSALQLQRMLGVTYRAAWFVMHRLRYAMAQPTGIFAGTVEMDETYVGGKRPRTQGRPGPASHKAPVVALVQRGGKVKAFPVPQVTTATLRQAIENHVHPVAAIMTDDYQAYRKVTRGYRSHDTVKHSEGEYVRNDAHTNTVEGFFSLLKRGINGTFHHVSKGHLHRYVDEFAFRYNTREALGVNDGERAAKLVLGAEGKRLTYKQPSRTSAA